MAEKKFAGAPFGTQTARFDVTGVHPKNKVPGSFTQMPYDKFSMLEMAENVNVRTQKLHSENFTVISKFDRHLKNIRQNLSIAKEQQEQTLEARKNQIKNLSSLPTNRGSVSKKQNTKPRRESPSSSAISSSSSRVKEHYNQEQFSKWTRNQIQMSQRASLFNAKQSRDTRSQSTVLERYEEDMSDSEDGSLSDAEEGGSGKKLQSANNNNNDDEKITLDNLNTSGGHNNLADDTSDDHVGSPEENVTSNVPPPSANADVTSISTSMKVHTGDLPSFAGSSINEAKSDVLSQLENNSTDEPPPNSIAHKDSVTSQRSSVSSTSSKPTSVKAPSDIPKSGKTGEETEVKLKSALSSSSNGPRNSLEKRVSFGSDTLENTSRTARSKVEPQGQRQTSQGQAQTPQGQGQISQGQTAQGQGQTPQGQGQAVVEAEQQQVRKVLDLLDTVKTVNTEKETSEQKTTVKKREWKKITEAKNKVFCGTCDEFLKRKLGPGTYNTMIGSFSNTAVDLRASGPGWARQLEVERLASLPHLLHKEQWEENRLLKRKLGPGSYEIKDFVEAGNEKPRSDRGICQNLAPRFEKGIQSGTPGPGTYGIGGVPQRAIEEKNQVSASMKGMLDAGDRKRNLPSVGSQLGPGTYKHKTCTEEMINKVTSLRGPYELYSGDRNKPISEGYLAAPKLADLGPGQYEIGSFVDEWKGEHKGMHGKFGKMSQYPDVPTDRIFLFSQAHFPKMKDSPGPGAYSAQKLSKPRHLNSPGFLSSAKRDDKISQKFFTRNFNPVGAGRYDIQKWEEAQDVNKYHSVFKSKSGKPNLLMSKFLQERIRAKDVSPSEKVFIQPPQRSLTVM